MQINDLMPAVSVRVKVIDEFAASKRGQEVLADLQKDLRKMREENKLFLMHVCQSHNEALFVIYALRDKGYNVSKPTPILEEKVILVIDCI